MKIMELPELPLQAWKETKMTLHLYAQIIGKIRLKSMPRRNHWWNITLRVNATGITTGMMPYDNGCFEIRFNFIVHRLEIVTSTGEQHGFDLHDNLSVATFYKNVVDCLEQLNIRVKIVAKPYSLPDENPITTPFAEITEYASYQKEYVDKFWKILLWVHNVFTEFGGRFYGKTSPVQIFWHHLDIAVTRFSDRRQPLSPGMRLSDKDAYSHEVVSFGFWAGDDNTTDPAFYSYTYPSPKELDKQQLQPATAKWVDNNGSAMALLMYHDVIKEEDPKAALLNFLESAYVAGASLAGWKIEELSVPALSEL
jgi:hypothetical protein